MLDVTVRADKAFAGEACGSSEHVGPAPEVRENGSMCHPGTTRDHVHRRVGEAVARELVQGGVEDPLVRYDFPIILGHRSVQLGTGSRAVPCFPVRRRRLRGESDSEHRIRWIR